MMEIRANLRYWLAEQPMVAHFRWDHHAWGSTWLFLVVAIASYLFLILFLKIALLHRKNPLPLGPIPAIHNLCVVLASLAIFVGCLEATAVEIRETRWIWRRSKKSAVEWIMCFPLGTRPSGRVFFWSYIFYLTKYHQLFDTVIWMLLKKPLSFLHVFHHVMVLCMCFVWLEFSQSLQIVGILANTLVYAVIYSYFLWRNMGLPYKSTDVAARLQLVHLVFTVVAYIGLLGLHFRREEGCNGMGAWLFNAFLNAALVMLFLNFYVKKYYKSSKAIKYVDSPCKRTKQL